LGRAEDGDLLVRAVELLKAQSHNDVKLIATLLSDILAPDRASGEHEMPIIA
jgi:hypothetical protein